MKTKAALLLAFVFDLVSGAAFNTELAVDDLRGTLVSLRVPDPVKGMTSTGTGTPTTTC